MDTFVKALACDGELFTIFRNGISISKRRAVWSSPLSTGKLHLIFFGESDLQLSDVLVGETGDKFVVMDTFVESANSKPYKRHVFCETQSDYDKRCRNDKIQEIKYWIPVVISNFIALLAMIVTIITSIN